MQDEEQKAKRAAYYKNYYAANKERLKQYQKDYCQANQEIVSQYHKEYREKYAERRRAYSTQWNKEHRDYKQEYLKQYHEKNKAEHNQRNVHYYSENSELRREYTRNYKKQFPEKVCALYNKRRTQKTQAGGSYTAEEWKALKAKYNYTCLCCGKQEPTIKLTADHVIPVVLNGSSYIENIQPLCRSCNSKKHNKIIDYRSTWEGDLRA